MQGVTIGGKHTFHTWGLLLRQRPIVSPPVPQTKLIQVPGTNTVIDLTETLTGSVAYEMRTITIETVLPSKRREWPWIYAQILNHMHGKRMKIILDEDPAWYYIGRVEVGELEAGRAFASITITAQVEPMRHKLHGTEVSL